MRRAGSLTVTMLVFCAAASAEESPDKSGFNLFRPTPDQLMRDMATDRPDKTESAYTVDAGHFQFEMDFVNYTHDQSKHETVDDVALASINLKVGILNNVDLQFIVEPYNFQRTKDRDTGRTSRASGFGDLTVRSKINLWGNDGGPTAFAVMPFVKIPTADGELGNGATEGGVIFPVAIKLPSEWELGAQIEIDGRCNEGDSGYHQEFSQTVTVGHDIAGKLAGYVELFNEVSNERHSAWIATFDFGFTYGLSRNVQLDAGMNIGLTEAADDLNPFIGLSVRY